MKQFSKLLFVWAVVTALFTSCHKKETAGDTTVKEPQVRDVWTRYQVNQWYAQDGWLRGREFIPSTAMNQLEMWQAETFDTATINRELGWAESIGFNSMRVYLHHLAWEIDSTGFKNRVSEYLDIANKHNISTLFVLFDDC